VVVNDIRVLCQDLDELGFPEIGGDNKFFINNNTLKTEDPQLNSMSYELSASRGCPFSCSYCCSPNLRGLYKGKGKYVRLRSVDSVINELRIAREKITRLRIIRFWDEIFCDDEDWIDEFTRRYKKEVNLPFEIWVHPRKVKGDTIKKLADAGLYKAVMGIQSGSCRVRKEIFGRQETEKEIINASKVLSDCKVPRVVYDFILRHPFETEEDIVKSFELCMKLYPPFELQLHALNFFPGTDVVKKAIKLGVMDEYELEKIMYAPLKEQYRAYWGINTKNSKMDFWYSLVYMTQFRTMKPVACFLAKNAHILEKKFSFIMGMPIITQKYLSTAARLKDYYKKLHLILQG
ncbi:MAG: radical SAM protein, partial [Clostridiaceae bacterium]|nr:radical SAM protein [Clostridiaceae bacterium]